MFTKTRAALPKQRNNRRRIIVIDIENLIGGAVLDTTDVHWAKECLREVIDIESGDQIVIGTSHIGLLATGVAWPNQRYVIGSGPDGADLALLEVLEEGIASRFAEVVLVSGDGIFTETTARLTAAGVDVHVIAHCDGLSRRLRMAASNVTELHTRYNPAARLGAA